MIAVVSKVVVKKINGFAQLWDRQWWEAESEEARRSSVVSERRRAVSPIGYLTYLSPCYLRREIVRSRSLERLNISCMSSLPTGQAGIPSLQNGLQFDRGPQCRNPRQEKKGPCYRHLVLVPLPNKKTTRLGRGTGAACAPSTLDPEG